MTTVCLTTILVFRSPGGCGEGPGRGIVVSGLDGSTVLRTFQHPFLVAQFASDAASLGDVDGDGVQDIAIVANECTNAIPGYVFVFSGRLLSSGGSGALLYTITGDPGVNGGYNAVAPGGDFDGDGITDLLLADGSDTSSDGGAGGIGRVSVYSGADGHKLFTLGDPTGASPSGFGKGGVGPVDALAGGVDLNQDGIPDILVGSPWANQAILFLSGALRVAIDIKPGDFPNTIKLGSHGAVSVAILSSATFDARRVNPTSITLAGAEVRLKGNGTPSAAIADVNGDGLLDLVVHVETEALELSAADTTAELKGTTFDGKAVRGTDSVRVVP